MAEAYPEGPEEADPDTQFNGRPQSDDVPVVQDDNCHYCNNAEYEPNADVPEVPLEAPIVSKTKKKTQVTVQLDQPEDDEPLADEPISRKSSGGSTSYFPITIGRTNQGAIAIANAFSNGRGGTAASRATAYGSPKRDLATSKKHEDE